jgi:hypothetical protein
MRYASLAFPCSEPTRSQPTQVFMLMACGEPDGLWDFVAYCMIVMPSCEFHAFTAPPDDPKRPRSRW